MACYPDADWSCDQALHDSLDAAVRDLAELAAWNYLNALLAYQVPGDLCPEMLRPCALGCSRQTWITAPVRGSVFAPTIDVNGRWINGCGCTRRGDCSCTNVSEIIMPGPVGKIVEVRQDGVIVDPSAYRVDNGYRLVRTDGVAWPLCQDMSKAPTEDGTLAVTWVRGYVTNPLLTAAAGYLAVEFAKACMGGECSLPGNVTSLVRQGVTMTFDAAQAEVTPSGIPFVDQIVRIYNPHGLSVAPKVLSPDLPKGRTSWPM